MGKVAIIIAAGEQTRWNNYLGIRKHFIKIDGEPIIKRTIRLLNESGTTPHVVGRDQTYDLPGSKLFLPEFNSKNFGVDKFLNSKELWSQSERTIVFYGDVYFSDKAMKTILEYEPREWTLFGREGASEITGTGHGECFAQSFYPEHLKQHEKALHEVIALERENRITRSGGWEHYRQMAGYANTSPISHVVGRNFVEINDWTDDFDEPAEYEEYMKRYEKSKK
jgi:hypothetical protein